MRMRRRWTPTCESTSQSFENVAVRFLFTAIGFKGRYPTWAGQQGDACGPALESIDPVRVALLESETSSYGASRTEATYVALSKRSKVFAAATDQRC